MLVVFDTNVFYTDVYAQRPQLRSVLDEAVSQAAYELFVPEVVLRELDKQFAQRARRQAKHEAKALGELNRERIRLGMDPLRSPELDEQRVAEYRATFEKRLSAAGVNTLPVPDDLMCTVDWAIARRKPFKESGEGVQDATIWLTVLALARQRRPSTILLVTNNHKDFGGSETPPRLAEELRADLRSQGCPASQVRLVAGIEDFAREVTRRAPQEAARRLDRAGAYDAAITETTSFRSLDRGVLALGVTSIGDPTVTAVRLLSADVEDVAGLGRGHLLANVRAQVDVTVALTTGRTDFATSSDATQRRLRVLETSDDEFVRAETDVGLRLKLTITSAADGGDAQAELDAYELSAAELSRRRLVGPSGEALAGELRAALEGHSVTGYRAEAPIDSEIDSALINGGIAVSSVRLAEILEEEPDATVVDLSADVVADVEWVSNSPSAFDVDQFPAMTDNIGSDAPILRELDVGAPLVVHLAARYGDETGWTDVEVAEAELDPDEYERRRSQLTASQELLFDEPEPDEPA